jgi:predicted phage terminase large subunit-like protein
VTALQTKLENLQKLNTAASELSLSHFVRQSWKILEPKIELQWNWHHSLICEHLEATLAGEINRLIINVPPRSLKSTISNICFPAWVWIKEPSTKFLCGSYADTLARKHSVLRRLLMESPWYQERWGNRFHLKDDQNVKSDYMNNQMGQMKASGINGSVTGEGGDFIIIDDPHNPKTAESQAERETALESFDLTWSSRLNDKKTGRMIIIMQRLHYQDLTGHLLEKGGWTHLCLPAEAETKTKLTFPMTKKIFTREPGSLLLPDREGPAELAQAKLDLGSYGYSGQYQQRPAPREGGIIKREWLKFYKIMPDQRYDQAVQGWDLSFKGETTSDFVAAQAWAKIGSRAYLFPDRVKAKMNFPETLQAFRQFSAIPSHKNIVTKLVEEKANGAALIAMLKKEVTGIIPVNPDKAKEVRLHAVAPLFEAGNVWLPDPSIAPWVHDYIEELTNFPNYPNDDQVDVTTMCLSRLLIAGVGEWTDNNAYGTGTHTIHETPW